MMAADNRSVYKWNQHPVISTVLWALETATSGTSKKEQVPPTTSALKWRDEEPSGKSSLNEYITFKPPVEQPAPKAAEEGTQLRPNATRADPEQFYSAQTHDNDKGGPADYTPSPNWGFYVPITPPQAEMFSAKPVEQKS